MARVFDFDEGGKAVSDECEGLFLKTMELSNQMISLVQEGQLKCEHDSCFLLYGIILDAAFKINLKTKEWLEEAKAGIEE
jgi:hypothetical protein